MIEGAFRAFAGFPGGQCVQRSDDRRSGKARPVGVLL